MEIKRLEHMLAEQLGVRLQKAIGQCQIRDNVVVKDNVYLFEVIIRIEDGKFKIRILVKDVNIATILRDHVSNFKHHLESYMEVPYSVKVKLI